MHSEDESVSLHLNYLIIAVFVNLCHFLIGIHVRLFNCLLIYYKHD